MSYAATQKPEVYINAPLYTIGAMLLLGGGFSYVALNLITTENNLHWLYLLMLIQLTTFVIAAARQQYNYLAFILFNHFITYSVAKYNQVTNLMALPQLTPLMVQAIQVSIIATLLIIASYLFARYFFFRGFEQKTNYQMLTMNQWQLLAVAGYVIFMPSFMMYIPGPFLIYHFATVAADMVLLLCSDTPGRKVYARNIRLLVFVSAIWYFLGSGMLTMVGHLAGYVFIAACLQRSYRRLLIPLLLTILASGIQTVKTSYRLYLGQAPNASSLERFEMLSTLLADKFLRGDQIENDKDQISNSEEDEVGAADSLLKGFSRVGDDSLERVLEWTPSRVPFWNGESYMAIPFIMVPRLLWPEKPSRHVWNKFGRTYGYLSEDDKQTSVGVSFLAEGYMNFGMAGMYGIALFFGVFVAFAERMSYYALRGHFYFTFMVFLMPLMNYGADLTSIINSVMMTSVVLILFRKQFLLMARRDDYS